MTRLPTIEPADRVFPVVRWDDMSCDATFESSACGDAPSVEARFSIAFVRLGKGFVLANVIDRGWCTPSGRVEPGETPVEAAIRETYEETGCLLIDPQLIGHYVLSLDDGSIELIPAFAGRARELGVIPPGHESAGSVVAGTADLPTLYFRWDPLLRAVFELAEQVTSSRPGSSPP